ncbi:hypothetical protein CMI42_00485 [Candidatus Pacearchaeota archaeon]|nr:hypothetical protein [Candidatus Pacearchaeota archaeon]|tara:strand:- start:134 stop:520 length:387 start_codon:yes stop_codon:yes gene_type:complete
MGIEMNLIREGLRDIRALGSWVFYLLFVFRVLVLPNQWPFVYQIIIAGALILIVEIFNKKIEVDYYVTRGGILAYYSSLFYNDAVFTSLVGVVFIGILFGSWYDKKNFRGGFSGLILGVVGLSIGLWL